MSLLCFHVIVWRHTDGGMCKMVPSANTRPFLTFYNGFSWVYFKTKPTRNNHRLMFWSNTDVWVHCVMLNEHNMPGLTGTACLCVMLDSSNTVIWTLWALCLKRLRQTNDDIQVCFSRLFVHKPYNASAPNLWTIFHDVWLEGLLVLSLIQWYIFS